MPILPLNGLRMVRSLRSLRFGRQAQGGNPGEAAKGVKRSPPVTTTSSPRALALAVRPYAHTAQIFGNPNVQAKLHVT